MPPQPATMRSRWTAYAALSTTLAAGVILKSLAQRPNFYSAAVYLSQSSANLMILCNMVFVTACSFLIGLQKFLYGPLRPIEIEQLYEKAWFAVTETCLAMTIFRGEIGAWFLVMFFSLLAGKVWGWIGEGRVEVLEQQQHNILAAQGTRLFHTRLALSLGLSVFFNMTMLDYIVKQVLHMARPDMMVMFGFEFAVLSITSLSTATRYALNLIEIGIIRGQKQKRIEAIRKERVDAALRDLPEQAPTDATQVGIDRELVIRRAEAASAAGMIPIDESEVEVEGWEGKGRWIFYLDLATDFFKLVIYLSFFFILLIFYGLPLHIMRDVFLTCRSFVKRIGDFMRYRKATRDMNERYPDATEAEIGENDCIICREEMRPFTPPALNAPVDPLVQRMRPKKLPCGHVLHFACLRSWLERQQICPTCRATVVPNAPATQAGAVAPGAAARAQHPQNGGNGRPRIFQIGPLRIGVGAARGNNMFEELQEQLANLNPLPAPAAPAPGNGPQQQQYGFGIRWDGIRRRAQGHRPARGSVQDHLDSVGRQIQREVDSLQASMGELQSLRDIQAQLTNIRLARQGQPAQSPLPVPTLNLQPAGHQTVTALTGQPQQRIIQPGSTQLPAGLTLPEGWTMMPLQPMQAQPVVPPSLFPYSQPVPPQNVAPPLFPNTINISGIVPVPQPQQPVVPPSNRAEPQNPAQQPRTEPTLANILRETREVLQDSMSNRNTSQNEGSRDVNDSIAESIRLNQELAQSRERMEVLTGRLRGLGQDMVNAAAGDEASSIRLATGQSPLTQSAPPSSQTASTPQASILPARSVNQQSRQIQTPEQNRQAPVAPAIPRPTPPSTQPSVNSSVPQRAPQMTRSIPSTLSNNTATRPTTSTAIDPPRQFPPTSQTSSTSTLENRTRSPHRPTRSIGSSWGFAGIEPEGKEDSSEEEVKDGGDDDDEDTTDDDEEEAENDKNKATMNGSSSRLTRASGSTTKSNGAATGKGKNPTVEDLGEDPD